MRAWVADPVVRVDLYLPRSRQVFAKALPRMRGSWELRRLEKTLTGPQIVEALPCSWDVDGWWIGGPGFMLAFIYRFIPA
jgi:hypothetical protein